MKIAELFGKGKTVFSCEVFPPKKDSPVDTIYQTLDGLKDIKPDFISVTFGAGGSQVNQSTREIAAIIQKQYHIPAMAHLTCITATTLSFIWPSISLMQNSVLVPPPSTESI